MHAAADQARAYLCRIKIVQVTLAGADKSTFACKLLARWQDMLPPAGSKRIAPARSSSRSSSLVKPTSIRRAYAELFCRTHAGAVVTAIACIAAIDDGGKAERLGVVDDGGKAGVLAVVAAISIVAGYLGSVVIHRKIEHGMSRPFIGLPINGLLKRSLLGRADERRGEMDEDGVLVGMMRAHTAAKKLLSTPPENPIATRPYAKSSSSADSLS